MAPTSPLDAVAELQTVVTQLAPKLRPQVLPNGAQYGLDVLLRLCATDEQRHRLRELVSHRGATQQDKNPYVVGTFDIVKRVFAIDSVQWLSEDEALVHELPRFLELQLNDAEKANEITSLFLQANGHKDSANVMIAQQCFNAAFALQAILRAFPELPVAIGGKTIEITETSDVGREIVDALFPAKGNAAASGKAAAVPTKKQKKRKANKQ